MKIKIITTFFIVLTTFPIFSQDKVSVEEKIKILEEEIEQLKEKKATKQYKSYDGLGPAASGVYFVEEGISFGGYGELKYRDNRSPYKTDFGDAHRFILYAGYKFNDWIVLNSEIEYEHAGYEKKTINYCADVISGVCKKETTTVKQSEVYLEFGYVDFLIRDYFKIAAGLLLNPVGITNYYHEPTTFFQVERPYTESRIIPSTWRDLGIMFHGNLFKDLVLYKIGIYNGLEGQSFSDSEWIRSGRQQGSKVKFQNFAYAASIEIYPVEGLTLGTSYYIGGAGQRDIQKVDILSRLDFSALIPGTDSTSQALRTHIQKEFEESRKINPKVSIGSGHFKYEKHNLYLQGLIARGWIQEDEVRALNAKTGKNIGSTVEGAYLTIGYDIASLWKGNKKLVLFYKNEYVNTQKRTLKNNGRIEIENEIALNSNGLLKTNVTYKDSSILNSINGTEIKTFVESLGVKGLPNPVNDFRVQTVGLAFYPHPNVSLKIDYEDWKTNSPYYQDSELYNTNNNNIDAVNLAVSFIF